MEGPSYNYENMAISYMKAQVRKKDVVNRKSLIILQFWLCKIDCGFFFFVLDLYEGFCSIIHFLKVFYKK